MIREYEFAFSTVNRGKQVWLGGRFQLSMLLLGITIPMYHHRSSIASNINVSHSGQHARPNCAAPVNLTFQAHLDAAECVPCTSLEHDCRSNSMCC